MQAVPTTIEEIIEHLVNIIEELHLQVSIMTRAMHDNNVRIFVARISSPF